MINKTLLEILVDELPGLGGWPDCAGSIVQDFDGSIKSVAVGAEAYLMSDVCWIRSAGGPNFRRYVPLAIDYATAIITREQYEQALAEKSHKLQFDEMTSENQQSWNGEGLPPVGTVCEALWNEASKTYYKTIVFGVNEHGQPIHRWEEGPKKFEYQANPLKSVIGSPVFRPIRTPEQIEAERRERACSQMNIIWREEAGKIKETGQLLSIYDCIYDAIRAGKIEGVKIDE